MAARPEPLTDLPVSPLAGSHDRAPATARIPVGRAARSLSARAPALVATALVLLRVPHRDWVADSRWDDEVVSRQSGDARAS